MSDHKDMADTHVELSDQADVPDISHIVHVSGRDIKFEINIIGMQHIQSKRSVHYNVVINIKTAVDLLHMLGYQSEDLPIGLFTDDSSSILSESDNHNHESEITTSLDFEETLIRNCLESAHTVKQSSVIPSPIDTNDDSDIIAKTRKPSDSELDNINKDDHSALHINKKVADDCYSSDSGDTCDYDVADVSEEIKEKSRVKVESNTIREVTHCSSCTCGHHRDIAPRKPPVRKPMPFEDIMELIETESDTVDTRVDDIPPDESLRCLTCGHKSARLSNFEIHMRTHTNNKPFECELCHKRFSRSSNYTRHIRGHGVKKPHICSVCDTEFTDSYSLKRHMSKHTQEKPFLCAVCGSGFLQKCDLVTHSRTHTGDRPYLCTICGASFAQRGNLNLHTRIHTGEKPNKCSQCLYTCSWAGDLKKHMRTHTGETPYRCVQCGYCSKTVSCLRRHMKIHVSV